MNKLLPILLVVILTNPVKADDSISASLVCQHQRSMYDITAIPETDSLFGVVIKDKIAVVFTEWFEITDKTINEIVYKSIRKLKPRVIHYRSNKNPNKITIGEPVQKKQTFITNLNLSSQQFNQAEIDRFDLSFISFSRYFKIDAQCKTVSSPSNIFIEQLENYENAQEKVHTYNVIKESEEKARLNERKL